MPALRPLSRFDSFEFLLCRSLNRSARHRAVQQLFAMVSRLGDGIAWYTLMAVLAVTPGWQGSLVALQMGLTALVGVALYSRLKATLVRERPFVTHPGIECGAAPLDRYSFPSGHTLQAVLFTTIALAWYPGLAPLLLPLVMMIALSRVVLGLHYPSDVLVGAAIGYGLARLSLWLYSPAAAL